MTEGISTISFESILILLHDSHTPQNLLAAFHCFGVLFFFWDALYNRFWTTIHPLHQPSEVKVSVYAKGLSKPFWQLFFNVYMFTPFIHTDPTEETFEIHKTEQYNLKEIISYITKSNNFLKWAIKVPLTLLLGNPLIHFDTKLWFVTRMIGCCSACFRTYKFSLLKNPIPFFFSFGGMLIHDMYNVILFCFGSMTLWL